MQTVTRVPCCNKLQRPTGRIDRLQQPFYEICASVMQLGALYSIRYKIFHGQSSPRFHSTMIDDPTQMEETLNAHTDYSLQFNRWILKPIGAWPSFPSTSRIERTVSQLSVLFCYLFILFTIVPCVLYIVLEEEDIRVKLKVLGPLSHWFIGGIHYTTLLTQNKEIRRCVQHMRIDWKNVVRLEDRVTMLRNARIGRNVAAFCTAFMQCGVLGYCTVSAFTKEYIELGNETRIIRMLPCAAYKNLIPVDTSPTNEIVLASQFVSGFIVNSGAVGAFGLAAVFAAHASGQLSVLMMWITESVNRSENDCFDDIGVIVEHHLRVLGFIGRIENVMTRICFMELLKSTLDICMLGYYILTEWADHDVQNLTTYFMIMLSMSFNIYLICYIGEILTEQCRKVGEVVYMTNWYRLPDKRILDLLLIISRSRVVINITAGKMVRMSVYTFGGVMKSAFAYLNLLRQVT